MQRLLLLLLAAAVSAHAGETRVRSLDKAGGAIRSPEGRAIYESQMSGKAIPAFRPLDLDTPAAQEILKAAVPAKLHGLSWNFLELRAWPDSPGRYIAVACTVPVSPDAAAGRTDNKQACAGLYDHRSTYTAVVAVLKQENGRYVPAAAPYTENTADAYEDVDKKEDACGKGKKACGKTAAPDTAGFSLRSRNGSNVSGLLMRFDFAPYRLNGDTAAFGLRIGAHEGYSGGSALNQAVSLFAVVGGRLKPVFSAPVYEFADIAGDWNPDGTRQHHISESESVLFFGQPHAGYNDIVLQRRGSKGKRGRTIYRWDAKAQHYRPAAATNSGAK
ncbi:Uncharacterised protein [Kingella potus]|uniref:Uncharacterized protein n=1 Tax=Kingella potus TaxID=265175 RepID=A0A377QZI4_9NEIS|nr:hypothetical protein [Kingella potus]STR00140.1 Uncharacterised protein [Kingella potus]